MNLKRENSIDSLSNKKIENHNGIKIKEISFVNKINLRIDPNNNEHMKVCGKILNTILPVKPNTYSEYKNLRVLWQSPDEWLIISYDNNDLFINLKKALGDSEASVTDVSENRTIFNISGIKLFKLLSKFMVLDFEKNLSNFSSCAQTLFVKVPILIIRNNNKDKYPDIDILSNKSHAKYIYDLIIDGTQNLDF